MFFPYVLERMVGLSSGNQNAASLEERFFRSAAQKLQCTITNTLTTRVLNPVGREFG